MNSQSKRKLGQLLREKAYLDESQLNVALAEQNVRHRRLGDILLELGYITQAQLNEALALQVKYNVLPLWREDGRLAVAMTNPFQLQVIEDLRVVTGCSVRRYYADPIQMENSILKFYGSNVARMLDNLVPAEQRVEAELNNGDYSIFSQSCELSYTGGY
ncbi:MAG: GspE/PulE/PilB domain-containing protein [Planctomycetota bacterium]|jgi:type IV pilus assembly protein PilB